MSGIVFLGWLFAASIGSMAIPGDKLDAMNDAFAKGVDSNKSCWDRVSGTPGEYGGPHNYSLDPLCNYRLKHVTKEGTYKSWTFTRG